MPATTALLDDLAGRIDTVVTHIALFGNGSEVTGGSPAYARQAVTWTAPSGGLIRPSADLTFNIPAGGVVDEWRGFSAASGGTDYGGEVLTEEVYGGQGTYILESTLTAYDVDAA